jgi:hypothetical protein
MAAVELAHLVMAADGLSAWVASKWRELVGKDDSCALASSEQKRAVNAPLDTETPAPAPDMMAVASNIGGTNTSNTLISADNGARQTGHMGAANA